DGDAGHTRERGRELRPREGTVRVHTHDEQVAVVVEELPRRVGYRADSDESCRRLPVAGELEGGDLLPPEVRRELRGDRADDSARLVERVDHVALEGVVVPRLGQ